MTNGHIQTRLIGQPLQFGYDPSIPEETKQESRSRSRLPPRTTLRTSFRDVEEGVPAGYLGGYHEHPDRLRGRLHDSLYLRRPAAGNPLPRRPAPVGRETLRPHPAPPAADPLLPRPARRSRTRCRLRTPGVRPHP